jgi:hypothetical protein
VLEVFVEDNMITHVVITVQDLLQLSDVRQANAATGTLARMTFAGSDQTTLGVGALADHGTSTAGEVTSAMEIPGFEAVHAAATAAFSAGGMTALGNVPVVAYIDYDTNQIISMGIAQTVNGVVTAREGGSVTIDGNARPISNNRLLGAGLPALGASSAPGSMESDRLDIGSTYTFILDNVGAVMAARLIQAGTQDFVFVLGVQYTLQGTNLSPGAANMARASVVFADGTRDTIDLQIVRNPNNPAEFLVPALVAGTTAGQGYGGGPDFAAGTSTANAVVGRNRLLATQAWTAVNDWFSYVKNADNTYDILNLPATAIARNLPATTTAAWAANAPGIAINGDAPRLFNSATVTNVFDQTGGVLSFTGLPGTGQGLEGQGSRALFVVSGAGNAVTNRVIVANHNQVLEAPAIVLGYYNSAGAVIGANARIHNFFVQGSSRQYTTTDMGALSPGLYRLSTNAANITTATPVTAAITGAVTGLNLSATVAGVDPAFLAWTGGSEVGTSASPMLFAPDVGLYDVRPEGAGGRIEWNHIHANDVVVIIVNNVGGNERIIGVWLVDRP